MKPKNYAMGQMPPPPKYSPERVGKRDLEIGVERSAGGERVGSM